jgi:hypothetical protein
MNTETPVVRIPSENLPRLQGEVDQLNRRAERLGVEPMVLVVHRTEVETRKHPTTGVQWSQEFSHVSIRGHSPRVNGWSLLARKTPVATVDAQGQEQVEMLIACVPGQMCPVEYRHNGLGCNHCGTSRFRKDVFVLRHEDGRTKQVGRNCLADFLGHASPDALVASAEYSFSAGELLGDAEEEGWGNGGGGERVLPIGLFLAVVAVVSRKMGWVSGKAAYEARESGDYHATSTASTAWEVLTRTDRDMQAFVRENDLHATDDDSEKAEKALAWARTLPVDDNDYLTNLGVSSRRPVVDWKSKGFVASALTSFARHLESEEERVRRAEAAALRATLPKPKHVGVVGERQGFAGLTVKKVQGFEGMYGVTTLVRFEDADRNTLVWWASGEKDFEVGQVVDVTGTVKAHEFWRDIPQTILQRVKEGLPKPKGKGRKTKDQAA